MKVVGITEEKGNVNEDQQGPCQYCSYSHYTKEVYYTCSKSICHKYSVKTCPYFVLSNKKIC